MKYVAALLLILFGFAARAQQATYGGVYIICNFNAGGLADANCQSALQIPDNGVLPGLFLNITWNTIQPTSAAPLWSSVLVSSQSVDTFLLNAKANNQNIALSVIAGKFAPVWARGATVECDPTYGPSSANLFPVPWDTTLISNYKAMILALKQHLTAVPLPGGGTVDVTPWVKIIKASGGINTATSELFTDGGINICTDSGLQFNQVWANAGFAPSKIQTAFNSLQAEYIADFPAPIIKSYEVIFVGAFPWVNESGALYHPAPNAMDSQTYQLLNSFLASQSCSERFAVQYNAEDNQPINTPQPAASVIQGKAKCGGNFVVMGGQTNVRGGQGVGGTGVDCGYGGNAMGTWVGTTNTINITNLSGYVIPGATTSGGTNLQAGGVVQSFTASGPGAGTIVFTANTTTGSATNALVSLNLQIQCNGAITGTPDGDFELIFDTATSAGQRWIEIHAVNNTIDASGTSQTYRIAKALAAKGMRLPGP